MKISYITMQFPVPSETFASNDVNTLKLLGVDVDVYTMKTKHKEHKKMCKEREIEDIKIYNCYIKEYLKGFVEILKSPFIFLSLMFWLLKNDYNKPKHMIRCLALIPVSMYIFSNLKKKKPDIVHLFWGHYPSLIGYIVKKKLPNIKLSLFLGAYDLEYTLGISKNILQSADFIFTHTKANFIQLDKLGIDTRKINVVYRGIDLKKFQNITEKDFNKIPNSWISAGRLIKLKNFESVIDVFYSFYNKNKDIKLLICGDGILKNELENKVDFLGLEKNIYFKGHLSQKKLFNYMLDSEIMILLSITERLPNVVKEAMLAGCICIVSETPGIDELIQHGVTGFIIPQDKYFEIPELILSLNDKEKEIMRYKAKEYIIDNFDVEKSMKKYLEIWQRNLEYAK